MSNESRDILINLIHNQKMKIVEASKISGVPYENAKAIYRIFRKEGRNFKKQFKMRKRTTKGSQKGLYRSHLPSNFKELNLKQEPYDLMSPATAYTGANSWAFSDMPNRNPLLSTLNTQFGKKIFIQAATN